MVAISGVRTLAIAAALLFSAAESLPNLRILPLGDSITKGSRSSHGNGCRGTLRQHLIARGIKVDMVGSLRTGGSIRDNDHEGHSGGYLAEMQSYLALSVRTRPNLVLIHAGTNNMDKNVDVDVADALMDSIIDDALAASPSALVLVAPVIWANDPDMQARTDAFNLKLADVVERRQGEGQHVLLAPKADIGPDDLADKKHPNDAGYKKMASAWFDAISEGDGRGWLAPPDKIDREELPCMGLGYREACDKGR